MKIRNKITLYFGPFVLTFVLAILILNYTILRQQLTEEAHQELIRTENSMYQAVQALLSTSIHNYLRGITEKNLDLIKNIHGKQIAGKITEQEAKQQVHDLFAQQVIGKSGYLVATVERGDRLFLDIHPFQRGMDCTNTEGCRQWDRIRNGYLEYQWQNPLDHTIRKKAAYVLEFSPWHWVIGASSYVDEFVDLVHLDDLRELIAPVVINRSGYFVVFNSQGAIIFHPKFDGSQTNNLPRKQAAHIFAQLKQNPQGFLTYKWKNPEDTKERVKYAVSKKLAGYDWYLVATGYLDEVHAPIVSLQRYTLITALIAGVLLLLVIFRLSREISAPLTILERGIQDFYQKNKTFSWQKHSVEEINVLGQAFARMNAELNRSIEDLQTRNEQLALTEGEIRDNRALLDSIIHSMPSIIIGVDEKLHVTLWNSEAELFTGKSSSEVMHRPLLEVFPHISRHLTPIQLSLGNNRINTLPSRFEDEQQNWHYTEITVYPLQSQGLKGAVLRIDDTTERVEMEHRLRQSQKMDAIGQLAGGVAHDFNNMLGGILGAVDVLRAKVDPKQQKLVNVIAVAAERASDLIRKLLAFARKENVPFSPVDIHKVLTDSADILVRTLDKKIDIELDFATKSLLVMGDWSQLQSSILNMGINAGHAMPEGGTLTFTTRDITLTDQDCQQSSFSLLPGKYVRIDIKDTGVGIPPHMLKRIFEPFFTTRTKDQGTGLGLAAVYGTMQQHQGAIEVASKELRGTTFTLLLPRHHSLQEGGEYPADGPIPGTGHILVIDDEPVVRVAARFMLEGLGYTVSEAENGKIGVEVYAEHLGRIDLVLLDMIMPVMDGTECFHRIKAMDPNAKIVIASAFTRDADLENLRQEGLHDFIRKPYTLLQLSQIIHRVTLESSLKGE